MSETEAEPGGTVFDDPNRQAVGLDPAWVEAGGGGEEASAEEGGLEAMTKDELLARAQELGASPANASMTKAELVAAIEAAEGE
jgi:hypothetical protein